VARAVPLVPGCAPGDGVACAALQGGLAAALAACDAIVLVLGTSAFAAVPRGATQNEAHEGEGRDRTGVGLAGAQGALLAAARAAGKPLAVAVASGGMVDVGDAAGGAALLAAPFGGQWAGDALAAVVLGDENPAARLTATWYTAEALAALGGLANYSMAGRTYRYARPGAARFPFGHGLSFSTFAYGPLRIAPAAPGPCDAVNVTFTLTNAAGPAGAEVAQLYAAFPGAPVPAQPSKALVNWEKVALAAGGAATLTLTITPEDNAVLREGDFVPVVEPGARTVWLGASSDEGAPGASGAYTVTGEATPLAQCGGGGAAGGSYGAAHVWPRPALGNWGGAARWSPLGE
jgi:beta-glucosidase